MSNAVAPSRAFFRPTTPEDIQELSLTMREEDRLEVLYSTGDTPLHALLRGVEVSNETCTIEWNGKVVAIFGVGGILGQVGCPWMLGTPDIARLGKYILKLAIAVFDGYLKDYGYLTNVCWSQNVVHISWLKRLGFKFEGGTTLNGEMFLQFHKGTYVRPYDGNDGDINDIPSVTAAAAS
jgi:hypothetical protein